MADENRKKEFEDAIADIRNILAACTDPKDQLAARKELNKLYRLYSIEFGAEAALKTESESSELLLEIRGHLEPLGLAPAGTPLAELARLAALAITQK